MGKSFFTGVEEWSGPIAAGGYKAVIEELAVTTTGENAKTPGAKMYTTRLRIVEPKKASGSVLFDNFVIGTEEDLRAKNHETWKSSAGARRLFNLLKRAGVPAKDGDDEEWMDAAAGQEVCVHVRKGVGKNGQPRNEVDRYFRETDDEFVGIGEKLEADAAPRSAGAKSARSGASGANGKARAARPPDDDDDAPPSRAKPDDDDGDDDDEAEAKPARAGKAAVAAKAVAKRQPAKGADADADDDED